MKLYVVDAFAEQLFEGNPAAVCVLEHYPKDELKRTMATVYVGLPPAEKSISAATLPLPPVMC